MPTPTGRIEYMKMIMAIINDSDVREVTKAMMDGGFYVTKIGSSGGFMRSGMTTLISTVHDENKAAALEILRVSTHGQKYHKSAPVIDTLAMPRTVQSEIVVGGATVFVLNVEESHKF